MEDNNKHSLIEKEALLNIAKIKNLRNKEYIEKDYFQDLFLYYLYKETNIFVFKGGTSLYKLYNLKRFSEDLDFSLDGKKEKSEIQKIIQKITSKIQGFEIKQIKDLKNSLIFKISCKGIITNYNTLRIDISLKNKILREIDIKNYTPDYIDINPFTIRALKPEEIISEKIHSLLNRKKARDLYDLFFLLKQFKFDKFLVDEKLKIFDQEFSLKELEEKINSLESIWKKELGILIFNDLPEFEPVKNYVLNKMEKILFS